MHSRSRRTPGRRAAAVRPAISGRNAPARSLRLVLSPKRNCCLVGCEGRREGERAGGKAGEGGGLGEGATGRGQLRKAGLQASQAGSDWTGLWALFFFSLKTHTRTYTRAHTHIHRVSPHLSLAFPLRLFFRCWPCSRQKVRGGPLPGQPSGEEAGGRALQPGQKSGPSQGLSGQAPAPPAGPRAQRGDTGQLSCASAPPPRPSRLPQHSQTQPETGQSWGGGCWLDLGSRVHPGQGLERSRGCGQNVWEGETVLLLPPWGIWVQGRGP